MDLGFRKADSLNLSHVDVQTVWDFLTNNIIFAGVKLARSGTETYGESAVGYVQVKRNGNICFIRGRICPEHRVRVKPYQVLCEVNEDIKEIIKIQCLDCVASAGGCKHAIAFLMWLHRRTEEGAPTTVECSLKKPVLSQIGSNIKFTKAVDIGKCKEPIHRRAQNCQGFLEEVVEKIKNHKNYVCPLAVHTGQPITDTVTKLSIHSILLDFLDRRLQHSADNFLIFCRDRITEEEVENASALSYEQSETSSWYEIRYGRITASKLYDAADAAVFKTANGVLTKQIMGVAKIFQSTQIKRGINLEKLVIAELEKQLSISVKRSVFIVLTNYGILGASPVDSVIEIKCPASQSAVSRYITSSGEVTRRFLAQINLQMLSRKVTKGVFCVAAPDLKHLKKIQKFTLIMMLHLQNILLIVPFNFGKAIYFLYH